MGHFTLCTGISRRHSTRLLLILAHALRKARPCLSGQRIWEQSFLWPVTTQIRHDTVSF